MSQLSYRPVRKFVLTLAGTSLVLGGLPGSLPIGLSGRPAAAAEELKLREGISFYQDIDSGFPIVADNMADMRLEPQHPTLIFFGASGDLNTNRQARRIVDLYRRYRKAGLKFLVVDVDHATAPEAKELLKSYYRGYIPEQVLLDRSGSKTWSQSGEVELRQMEAQVDKLVE